MTNGRSLSGLLTSIGHLSFVICHLTENPCQVAWIFALVPLASHEVHKLVKFRTRAMLERRAVWQFETADQRRWTRMSPSALIGVHRRFPTSAVWGSLAIS